MRLKLKLKPALIILPILFAGSVNAAVPKHIVSVKPASLTATKEALQKPLIERLGAIRSQGSEGYRNLVAIMFDENGSMDTRWKAVTASGRVGGREAKPELVRALKSKEWFMRNAGLVALTQLDRDQAVAWSHKLIDDKSLIVRTAAVDVIRKTRDVASVPLLWKKLDAKENFRGHQSLFIRRRIVEVLSTMEQPGHESKFITVLNDPDTTLHPIAIAALERMTKQTLGTPSQPVAFKKAQWEKWYRDSKAM